METKITKKGLVKLWLTLTYKNDKHNTIFETYNDYLDSFDSDYDLSYLEDNEENFNEILNENGFLKYILINIGINTIKSDLKEWGVKID